MTMCDKKSRSLVRQWKDWVLLSTSALRHDAEVIGSELHDVRGQKGKTYFWGNTDHTVATVMAAARRQETKAMTAGKRGWLARLSSGRKG